MKLTSLHKGSEKAVSVMIRFVCDVRSIGMFRAEIRRARTAGVPNPTMNAICQHVNYEIMADKS